MKNFKTILLTLILSIGFLLPSCEKESLYRNPCGGVDDSYRYFNIEGLNTFFLKNDTILGSVILNPNDTIPFTALRGILMEYEVSYHAHNESKWSFSLINSMMACTYVSGYDGSKNETLTNFSITTLNDFDAEHLANSSIIDLFNIQGTFSTREHIPLEEFLANQTENIKDQYFQLYLTKAPELANEFRFKIAVELSTGESYETESESIYFKL